MATSSATFFAGIAPGFAGLYQVNFEIPKDLPQSAVYRSQLEQGGSTSNSVTVRVN